MPWGQINSISSPLLVCASSSHSFLDYLLRLCVVLDLATTSVSLSLSHSPTMPYLQGWSSIKIVCNAYITLLLRSRCLIANLLIYGGGGSSSIFTCLHQWCHLPVNFLVSLAILESFSDNSLNCQQPSNGKLISLAKEPADKNLKIVRS